jgi:hypothetical protein
MKTQSKYYLILTRVAFGAKMGLYKKIIEKHSADNI